jgi:hypothetical protein
MRGSSLGIVRIAIRSLLPLGLVTTVLISTDPAGAAIPQHVVHAFQPTCSSSTPITFGAPPSSGTISDPSGPPVCFTFDADVGDSVFINAISTSESAQPEVTLVDPNGNVVSPTDLQTSGTYTIEVTATAPGTFNIYLQRTDNPVGCTTVTIGGPAFPSTISDPGQAVCLRYSAPYTEWLSILIKSEPAYLDIIEYAPDGLSTGAFNGLGASHQAAAGSGTGGDPGEFSMLITTYGLSPATGSIEMNLASIQLSAWSGKPGVTEAMFASGFDPGEYLTFYYMTGLSDPKKEVICKALVSRNGQPTCKGYLPPGRNAGTPGYHLIMTRGAKSHHVAKADFLLK